MSARKKGENFETTLNGITFFFWINVRQCLPVPARISLYLYRTHQKIYFFHPVNCKKREKKNSISATVRREGEKQNKIKTACSEMTYIKPEGKVTTPSSPFLAARKSNPSLDVPAAT